MQITGKHWVVLILAVLFLAPLGPLRAEQAKDINPPAKAAGDSKPTGLAVAGSQDTTPAAAAPMKQPLKVTQSPNQKLGSAASKMHTGQAGTARPQPRPFTTERFYRLLLDRYRVSISSNKQILKILNAHGGDPIHAMKDLKIHEREREQMFNLLFERYGISPQEYYRSVRGSELQQERAEYLDNHPEIRDEIAAKSQELKALEEEVWQRMYPLWTASNQAPQ